MKIHCICFFSACCLVLEKSIFIFQFVKYWKFGLLAQWENSLNTIEVLFLPENYNVEIIEFMQNSHKWYSFFEHQCSWDCNISSYDWHFLSPLCPLLMKMLNRSQGALLLDRATGAWACCGREAAGERSRAVLAGCARHWKKGDDPGRWQCQITVRLNLHNAVP